MFIFKHKWVKRDETGDSGDSGGGMSDSDLDDAVSQISEGLGFLDNDDDPDPDDGLDDIIDGKSKPEDELDADGNPTDKRTPDEKAAALAVAPTDKAAGDVAPVTWRKEAAEKWALLPPEIKAEVQKREDDMMRGIEQYKGDAAVGKTVLNVMQPYLPIMQQHNINPANQIANLMSAHHLLATGSQAEKTQFLQKIAQDYGISITTEADNQPGTWVDPTVANLQAKMQQLESKNAQQEYQQRQQVVQTVEKQVAEFAADPKNGHFDKVADDIGKMLKAGAATTLQEAYEKAVWANPATRQLEQARLQAEAADKAKKELAEKQAQVKRSTAGNVKSRARDGGSTARLGSMEDTMREVAERMMQNE